MFGKKVHVHGELAKKQEVHPPQVRTGASVGGISSHCFALLVPAQGI
jgi:hypothetical protein